MAEIYFDVCNTITQTNNTNDFILYYFIKKNNYIKIIKYLYIFFLYFIKKTLNFKNIKHIIDIETRKNIIGLLKNEKVSDVKLYAQNYVEQIFKKGLLNEKIIEILNQKRKQNKIIFLSASINPPIEEIAKKLNIDKVYCSKLQVKNNKYTGVLEIDLYNNKQIFINKKNLKKYFYTDNIEDLNLIKYFNHIYFINNNKKFLDNKITYINIKENDLDTNAVNNKNKFFIYIPCLYYFISRIRIHYFIPILFRELFLLSFLIYFLNKIYFLYSLFYAFLSYICFFSIYEIGGLYNDLADKKDKSKTNRIAKKVKININIFLLIRFLFLIFILFVINKLFGNLWFYYFIFLVLVISIYILHSKINNKFRIITFVSLKILRVIIPLLILNNISLIFLSSIYVFSINGIGTTYAYLKKKNLIKTPINFFIKNLFLSLPIIIISYLFSLKYYNYFFLFYAILVIILSSINTILFKSKIFKLLI